VKDAPKDGKSSTTQESWKGAAANAVRKFSEGGSVSAAIAEMVDGLVDPKMTWREELRKYMTTISRDDFSWEKPNRRFVCQGLYLPSAHSEKMGDIVLAIDTSGSINKKALEMFMSEVRSILEEVEFDSLQILQCNTRVVSAEQFFPGDEISTEVKGGGGTRFQPVFDWVEEYAFTPDVLLYFTDLAIPEQHKPKDPGYPVLWIEGPVISKYRKQPEFGEVITLTNDEE